MDTTTHGLAGYVIAKTGLARDTGKWGTIAGVTAAVFPDIDLFLGFLGTEFSLKYHRHLLNSVFMIVPFSLALAWVFVRISKIKRFWTFFLLGSVEMLVHTFFDMMGSYGTMILSPFSNTRFFLDWVFIVDFILAATLLVPMLCRIVWKGRDQVFARVGVLLAGLYIAFCGFNHSWALSLTKDYARENGLPTRKTASIPQPLSPFRWGNYIMTEKKIYQGYVNLLGGESRGRPEGDGFVARFLARYQPVSRLRYEQVERYDDTPWVEKALSQEGVEIFFWFARFPVARDLGVVDGRQRVEFHDLRFSVIDGVRSPFVYVVDFDRDGKVVSEGFD
jgi:inner membrane protein